MKPDDLDFSDECELQEWLKQQFRSYGWKAIRETSPAGTDYRADLIVHHDNWGWIGIECKYMSSPRNGKKVGEAIEQILYKYRGERYPIADQQIDLWALCPYIENVPVTGINQTIRETLCHLGIGILWPGDMMKIDFSYSSSDTKILLGDEEGEQYGDRDRIREMVQKKIFTDDNNLGTCQYDASGAGCHADAVDTVTVGSYEVALCKHHIHDYEIDMWSLEKQARSSVNQ